MAGEFVVYRITPTDIAAMKRMLKAKTTEVAHAKDLEIHGHTFPGWCADNTNILNQIRRGETPLESREALPPHFYVEVPADTGLSDAQIKYLHSAPWMANLQRPSDPNFGSAVLKAKARDAWALGNKVTAFVEQLKTGNISVEIYYVGSRQVSKAALSAINKTIAAEEARLAAAGK